MLLLTRHGPACWMMKLIIRFSIISFIHDRKKRNFSIQLKTQVPGSVGESVILFLLHFQTGIRLQRGYLQRSLIAPINFRISLNCLQVNGFPMQLHTT